jgi:pimeloyl-ACP methyl ester carboxylesterase
MHASYVTLGGIPCRVLDSGGGGRLFVLVHGLGGYAENWSLIADDLARLGRVVAVDLPGFGLSAPARRHDLDTHVDTVAHLIGRLGAHRATVVGNSMGGLVAELLAVTHPALVERLVLIAPATPWPGGRPPTDPATTMRLAVRALPVLGPVVIRHRLRTVDVERHVDEIYRIVAHRPHALPHAIRALAIRMAELRRQMPWTARAFSESARSIGRTLVARSRFDRLVDAIPQPTTLIWGARDRVVTPASLERLAARRPTWHSAEVPEAGHVPMLEQPALVSGLIAEGFEPSHTTGPAERDNAAHVDPHPASRLPS